MHFKIPAPAEFFEQLHVAGLLVAEAKILAHEHSASAQSVHEIRSREILRADFRELLIEFEHEGRVHSGIFKACQSLRQSGEKQGSFGWPKNFRRMRIKSENRRDELLGFLAKTFLRRNPVIDCFENLLMAEVQAVEVSDRDSGANGQIAESAIPLGQGAM